MSFQGGCIDATLTRRPTSASFKLCKMDTAKECSWCERPTKKLMRCSRCKNPKDTYCSKKCQRDAWPSHIFRCQPGQYINTAYRLYKACIGDVMPDDEETRRDYGFTKAERTMGGAATVMLCGLYRGLFVHLDVAPQDVHKWRREGRLVQGIKDAFERIPPQNRGAYFPWFLEHQSVLDNDAPDDDLFMGHIAAIIRAAWIKTGGSPSDSLNVINSKISILPPSRQACHIFYRAFANNAYPNPIEEQWLKFGFVATLNNEQEANLGVAYRALLNVCTFEELCTAYEESSIPALFERYLLQCTRHFRDVMAGTPHVNKSVWDLKQYVDKLNAGAGADSTTPVRSAAADYGYINCKTHADRERLDTAYKRYFAHPQTDPIALHHACIQGKLLQYLAPFVQWEASQHHAYAGLLWNMYPLRTAWYAALI